MLLQVWLPVGLALLAVAGAGVLIVLAALKSSPVVSQASSVSIIFMLMPFFVIGLFNALLIALGIYLVARLSRKIPPAARTVQGFLAVVDHKTSQVTDRAAAPFIKVRSIWAAAKKILHRKR